MDVAFGENDSRIRRDHAPEKFNTRRQFALNLIKRRPAPISVKGKRFKATLDDSFCTKIMIEMG